MNSADDLTSLNSKQALFLSFQSANNAGFYYKADNVESTKSTGGSTQVYPQHQQFMLSFVAMALCHIRHNQNLTFKGSFVFQRCLNDLSGPASERYIHWLMQLSALFIIQPSSKCHIPTSVSHLLNCLLLFIRTDQERQIEEACHCTICVPKSQFVFHCQPSSFSL